VSAPLAPPTPAPHRAGRLAGFADAVRAEWLKLVSLRSTWTTLAVTAALGVGVGALVAGLRASRYASGELRVGWDPTRFSLSGLMIAQLAIAVLGVLAVSGEYGTGMIRTSLVAVPRRGRFLAAKLTVFAGLALVVGEVIAFAAFFVGQLVIGSQAPQAGLGQDSVLRAVLGAGLYLAAVGLLAAGAAAILRNTAASISAMVALLFVLPGVALALPTSWANTVEQWWPTQAGAEVFALHRDPTTTFSAWSGFGIMLAFTAAVIGVGWWLLERRDA
jgi:ABC-2 type transport system permease protein